MHPGNAAQTTTNLSGAEVQFMNQMLMNPQLLQQLQQQAQQQQVQQQQQQQQQQQLLLQALQNTQNVHDSRALQEVIKAMSSQAANLPSATTSTAVTAGSIGELTVDTTQPPAQPVIKSSPVATPQVAEDHTAESQQLAAEKAEVSDCLEATEKNIKKNDTQIETLTKRKQRFLQVANEEDDVEDETVEEPESEAQAIPSFQQIIDENVKRKNDLEATFPPHLRMPEKSTPLYLEPCDVPGMKELAIRQIKFAPQLRAYIRRRTMQQERNATDWEEEYRERYCDWYHKDQDNQLKPDRQLKEIRWRQIFESTFKELSKQRGDKERQSRVDGRLEYLAVTTEDQDAEKKKRNAAVVPPMMHCQVSRRNGCLFRNENHIQSNVALREKRRINAFEATWSDQDLAMFKNRLKLVGKNFANIAMFFPEKSVKDCVQCYYLLIKKLNKEYKSMLPKTKRNMKKKYRPPVMPTPAELAKYQQNPDAESSTGAPIVPDVKCSKCHQKLETNQVSIRVTRAFADAYGKEKKGIDVQICPKCHEAEQRIRSGRCLVKDCFASNRKLKPTKALPTRWKQMDERQKAFLLHDMGIPRDITKTCHNCNKKIIKRLEQLLAGELDDQIVEFENNLAWDDTEVANLLHLIEEMGTDDWEGVAEHMEGRDAEECRIQWTSTRKPVDVHEEAHPSEEDEEETEDAEKENGIDETMLEEDTLDVPDDEIKAEIKEEIKPEIIELSPDPMDTSPPGPAILDLPSTAAVDAIPSTAKIGSITAGTPLRPSSVTILDSTPQPGPSNVAAAGPPGTAPPQSSSARATPQGVSTNLSFGQPVEDAIRKLIANPEDQKKIMQQFALGIGQANNLQVNPSNPYLDALRQNAAGNVPPAVLAEMQKIEQERMRQHQQQQQQQADAAQRQAQAQLAQVQSQAAQAQLLLTQINLIQQQFGGNAQDINRIIQMSMSNDPMAAQLLRQLQNNQQQPQQPEQTQQQSLGQMPKDLIGKYEYSIKNLEIAMNEAKTVRLNLAYLYPTAPESAVQQTVARIQESFQQPYRLFTNCKHEIETMIRKLQQDIAGCKAKEKSQAEQIEHLEAEKVRVNQQLLQIQMLAQQPQFHLLMAYQNIQALLAANMQGAGQLAAQAEVAKKELQMTTASKQKLMEQLTTYEQVRARGNHIPPTLTAIYEQVSARATEELNTMLTRGGGYPQTTMAQIAQQQHQQLLLQQHQQIIQQYQQQQQQQNQQLQTLQKQQAAQAASAAAAQKLAQQQAQQAQQQQQQQAQTQPNLPVRKDNTWVAEMEKQTSRPSMAPPNRNSILNTVGKKMIGEELAAQQQMTSPSTAAQLPQPSTTQQPPAAAQPAPAAGPAEPIKRKSGVETVYMDKVSAKPHPHMRRPGSPGVVPTPIPPLPGNPPAAKPQTSRTGTTPLAVHTSMPGMDNFYSSPAALEKNPADFVSRLRLPTQEQQSFPFASGLTGSKEPEVHRKTGMVRLPEREEAASSYSDFPFVICPTSLERPTVSSRGETSSLGASQLVSPGVLSPKAVSTMTLDNSIPSTSVGDVAHGVQTKPAMANGLLGEIEPMSPDSPKPAAISPAKLGGDHAGEGRLYSMMDDVFFEDDGPVFRPISPNSCLYKEPFLDSPLEDISSDDEPAVQMDS